MCYYIVLLSFSGSLIDYGAVSTLLMFDSCETQQCTNITITNDVRLENTESFLITLRTTDNNNITLHPVVAEIKITDDDGWLVGCYIIL